MLGLKLIHANEKGLGVSVAMLLTKFSRIIPVPTPVGLTYIHGICCFPMWGDTGAHPTNDISIELEIRSELGAL